MYKNVQMHTPLKRLAASTAAPAANLQMQSPDVKGFPTSYDTANAASYLGCSASHLNKLRCEGGGPAYYVIGRRVRYLPKALDEWRDAQVRASTSDGGKKSKSKKQPLTNDSGKAAA
jgi:Helix-turn-helix domain